MNDLLEFIDDLDTLEQANGTASFHTVWDQITLKWLGRRNAAEDEMKREYESQRLSKVLGVLVNAKSS